ncbi:MAG TPA: hypothetical protein VFH99_01910 [Candidatus Saccharimonadales bacterium]|nr:hypothetical protein [Candidatus Saccharimonadales bacterium]
MTTWWIAAAALAAINAMAFIWLAVRQGRSGGSARAGRAMTDSLEKAAKQDVERIFNDEFRQELRNRGRLHFEKIISENAMFLQQDLRLTTSQVNEYMKSEITKTLKEEFNKYEQSIMDAKNLALESLEKTSDAIDEQRKVLTKEVEQNLQAEKAQLLKQFETNMAGIINHYVLAAIGDQIDLNDQLEYILGELETNKKAIIEDIQNGA